MGLSKTNLDESEESQNARKDKQGCFSSFKRWLVKGTVAEPWTTPEEFMENKEFQRKMKEVRKVIDKAKTNSK